MIDLSTTITVASASSTGSQSTSVPDPSVWTLMLLGLAALMLSRRSPADRFFKRKLIA
jgi:MYXO-CTERM domain-containing protein